VASNFEENLDKTAFASPVEYAVQNAFHKAMHVAQQLMRDSVST
jgi:predicted house-cleaning NTP pyrophosphatase (Maf/HAM1 superfamily)